MAASSGEQRKRYNVGVRKLPFAKRDLAHRVITEDDSRGFLNVMGADTGDYDDKFPVGAHTSYCLELTEAEAEEFRAASNVRYVEEQGFATFGSVPTTATLNYMEANFSGVSTSWHGRDVPVAIIDCGTTAAARKAMGWTLVARPVFGPNPSPREVWDDGLYHGSLAASCGVPPGGLLADLLIGTPQAGATDTAISQALIWAADHGIKIASASFALPENTNLSLILDSIDYFGAQGGQLFCSAGNNGVLNGVVYPAYFCKIRSYVHAVIAFDERTDTRAPFSDAMASATGCAPGVNVAGIDHNGRQTTWGGTSASAPLVASLCARGATGGRFTPTQVAAALRANTRDTGQPDVEQGHGAFSLQRAVRALTAVPPPPPPTPVVTPGVPSTGLPNWATDQASAWITAPVVEQVPIGPKVQRNGRAATLVSTTTDALTPVASSMPGSGLPTWRIDTLLIVNGSHIDTLGRQWTVAKHPQGEKGWTNPPGPRTSRSDRIDAEGSWRSRSYRKERLVTLSGSVLCPDAETREWTEAQLATLCDPAGGLYTYRRTTGTFDQCIEVELDDEPLIDVVTLNRVDWSFRFAAPDPRKHDYQWQEPRADPPQAGLPGGGLDDSSGGLDDSSGGLDDLGGGVPGIEARPAKVGNYGTAPARPFFELRGGATGLVTPRIVRTETGEELRCRVNIFAGETVWINCDQFSARGVPAQMCISSTRGDVSSLWNVGATWMEVAAQDVATFALDSAGERESLTVALRSAYR